MSKGHDKMAGLEFPLIVISIIIFIGSILQIASSLSSFFSDEYSFNKYQLLL